LFQVRSHSEDEHEFLPHNQIEKRTHSPGWSRVFRSSWGCCFLCLFPLQQV
ncbi:hypothetical protein Anapl_06869, partial [Anas platyrhynchos]